MKKLISYFLSFTVIFLLISTMLTDTAYADNSWPLEPEIFAEAGVVIEASTGTVLYNKNMDQKMYPASITKILTSLVALENSSLDEQVTYSHDVVYSLTYGDANMGAKEGEVLSMKDSLYGVLLASANEAASAVAEHVGGSIDNFAQMMTKRAKEAGAVNSNFVNANGLFNENHYTTCYDMAMITRDAIKNQEFLDIEKSTTYTISPTNMTPESRYLSNRHKMLFLSNSVYYEGILGGKTGYVDQSGNTLVTFARRNNMTLISVVMKSDSSHVYEDTTKLLDYGYNNFKLENISRNETAFSLSSSSFQGSYTSVFGDTIPLLSIDKSDYIVLPDNAVFSDADSELDFVQAENSTIATLQYKYNGVTVGKTSIKLDDSLQNTSSYSPLINYITNTPDSKLQSFNINIWYLLMGLILLVIIVFVILFFRTRTTLVRRKRRSKRKTY